MKNGNYQNDLKKFWEKHNQARNGRDEYLTGLTFSEKIAITENLLMNGRAIKGIKADILGLNIKSPDAVNIVPLEMPLHQDEFGISLQSEIFPKNTLENSLEEKN